MTATFGVASEAEIPTENDSCIVTHMLVGSVVRTRRVGERGARRYGFALFATLGVACAGRSISEVGDESGGTGGTKSGTGGTSAVTAAGVGGASAPMGSDNGGRGGTHAIGGGGPSTGARGGTTGTGCDGGGCGPFPVAGSGGRLGTSGDGGGFEVQGGSSGRAGNGGVGGFIDGWGGDAGAPQSRFPCTDPRIWSSNAIECAGGDFIHRPVAGTCSLPPRDGGQLGAAGADGSVGGAAGASAGVCSSDADCGSKQYCVNEPDRTCSHVENACVQACESDADCGVSALCLCDTWVKANGAAVAMGTCVPSYCHTDADCFDYFLCIAEPRDSACQTRPGVFACQSPQDECGGTRDCSPPYACAYQDAAFTCTF
jgi:hypothetical protein